jgi:hypothetical protein
MLTLLETWRLKPAVQALMAFRGFQIGRFHDHRQ